MKGKRFIVKTMQDSDRAEWECLYLQYAEFYKMEISDDVLQTVWQWISDKDMTFYGVIARDETGKAHSIAHVREMTSPLRGTIVGFLDDLFVDPAYRGQGAVDAMFEYFQHFAKEKNWPFVRWVTAPDNHRAQAVYNKIADKTPWVTYQMNVNQD